MFCRNCGAQLPDDSRFCDKCGTPVNGPLPAAQPAVQQPVYQQPAYQQPVYQQPAYQQPVYQQPVVQQPVYQQPVYQQPAMPATGALLMDAGEVTCYNGDKAIGVVAGAGKFLIYDDRVEFYKKSGSQAGFALNPIVGLALSAKDAKKNPVETYYFRDIASVNTAKHAGLISKLVIKMKSGKAWSFTVTGRGNKTNETIEQMFQTIHRFV